MPDGFASAVVSAGVALAGIYATQFIAEDYRRFKDASSLAAALAGELRSYEGAQQILLTSFETFIACIRAGRREELRFRPPGDKPKDFVFEAVVSKLGLLTPELAEGVVLVYGLIRAFRTSFELVNQDHAQMDDNELLARCEICLQALIAARQIGDPLVQQLKKRATARFTPSLPW